MTNSEKIGPVLIAGGGPVGMTLALELARHGVASTLVERNSTTTRHPKMDLTNGRSMELFRRLGIVDAARAAGVPEDQDLDITYATSATGYLLHRFNYGPPAEFRTRSRELNDGTMTLEPPMRVSQVMLEPVLKAAIDAEPLIDVMFGWAFDSFSQDADGVSSDIVNQNSGERRTLRSQYLAGCDGGGSRVRKIAGIGLEGDFGIVPIYMVHFRSEALDVLAKFGAAYHLQTGVGTLISQNGRDIWTLHAVLPPGSDLDNVDEADLLRRFAGQDFDFEILVANHWTPHQVVADRYREGRVFLAGDAAHQFIPTGGYGMNTGVWDAADLGWKLSAVINGWGGEALLESVEERRKIALQNRDAAASNMGERFAIEGFIQQQREQFDLEAADNQSVRDAISAEIQRIGNAENESYGIEHGYRYIDSPVISYDQPDTLAPVFDRLRVQPSAYPGCRLPHFYLGDGSALYDRLGREFTLITLGTADGSALLAAAEEQGIPVDLLALGDEPSLRRLGYDFILVRPDHHIAWSGTAMPNDCAGVLARVAGHISP
ncbi:FAD-dependent monooxygenase [Spongiibacter taiwanensis]|uniref:FAD-dependent monooxygenase n=1 Tax=Spongiibacter taiwanensis TaxID=1748242 RepID=UPI0020355713|nr:FAD-dependent monooxygenase [Spongiibacter taiwanensis]USA42655.1 FAD-dependent monooxygenase [Spongiibacter taiwanensis]